MYKSIIILAVLVAVSNASVAQLQAVVGQQVEINLGQLKALKRVVSTGTQIFHFDGENKGFFVDQQGNKIDSSNYSATPEGVLIIKHVSQADAGYYESEPQTLNLVQHGDGSTSATPGLTIQLTVGLPAVG